MKKNDKVKNTIALLAVGLMTTATTQAALVGHWTFDETSGTNAVDATGNGYDGAVVNPVWATNGVIGGALEMNGTDCNVSGFGNVLSTVSDELTISFWCAGDLKDPQNMNGFSGYDAANARKLNAHLPNGTTVYFDANSGETRERISKFAGSGPLVRGPWNHWAFTKNAVSGYMAIYLNGALWHDSTETGPFNSPMAGISQFFIGSDGGGAFFKGMMDDFRVYDNELSATEITNIFSAVTLDYAIAYAATATPDSGSIPYDAVFDGSSSISTTNIIDYAWNFGDGSTGNGMMVTNTYTAIGFYTNTLTITDANGNVDSVQLVVEAKPVPPVVIDWTVESGATYADVVTCSTNDLAQTAYESSSGVRGVESKATTHTKHAEFFDGILVGDPANEGDETATIQWGLGGSATIVFDTTVNTLGYDITNIVSIAGWKTSSNGRSNQGYEVVVTNVLGEATIIAASTHWAPNDPAMYWTKVNLFEENHGVMASGVKSVTFNFTFAARPGGRVMGREIDIFGVPSEAADPDVPTIAYTNNNSSLTWNVNGAFLYSVQTNLDLVFGEWGTFTNVVGTPPSTTVVLPPQNQNTEFYRVIVE